MGCERTVRSEKRSIWATAVEEEEGKEVAGPEAARDPPAAGTTEGGEGCDEESWEEVRRKRVRFANADADRDSEILQSDGRAWILLVYELVHHLCTKSDKSYSHFDASDPLFRARAEWGDRMQVDASNFVATAMWGDPSSCRLASLCPYVDTIA